MHKYIGSTVEDSSPIFPQMKHQCLPPDPKLSEVIGWQVTWCLLFQGSQGDLIWCGDWDPCVS